MSLPMTITGRLVFYRVSHMNVTVPGLQTIFLHIFGYSRELPFDTLTLLAIQKGSEALRTLSAASSLSGWLFM
jgi:hypothetical protein